MTKRRKRKKHDEQVSRFMWQIKKSINHCGPLTGCGEEVPSLSHGLFMKLSPSLSKCVCLCSVCLCVCVGWMLVDWWVLSEIFKCLRAFYTGPVAPQRRWRLYEGGGERFRFSVYGWFIAMNRRKSYFTFSFFKVRASSFHCSVWWAEERL